MAVKSVQVERTLPNNPDAERAVLGSILLNNRGMNKASEILSSSDFFLPANRTIFLAMTELQEENQGIDIVTVGDWLARNGKLELAGGYAHISNLASETTVMSNVGFYARIVKEKSVLRQMIYAAETVQGLAVTEENKASDIAGKAVEMFSNLANWDLGADRSSRKKGAVDLIELLDKRVDSKVLLGIPRIDDAVGGFRGGELIVLTAETGAGKSFMALQIARLACIEGEHGLYCSGEMKAAHLMGRELVGATGVAQFKIRRPTYLTAQDFNLLVEAASHECEKCMILDGELTLPSIRSAVRGMGKGNIHYLIVDYDELVEVNGAQDEWDAQRRLVRGLKTLGMEMDMPVFLVSQLRKALNDNEREHPTLQRLYGSGAKIKHASVVLYLDRPFVLNLEGDQTEATIFILKSRDGVMGKTPAKFNIRTFRFEQAEGAPEVGAPSVPLEPVKGRRREKEDPEEESNVSLWP